MDTYNLRASGVDASVWEHTKHAPVTNVFEAVLGKHAVKWDAFWRLFEWLVSIEGHGLGDSIRVQLLAFAFGQSYEQCLIKREYPVSGQTDGKGKWADFALAVPTFANPTHLIVMDDIGAAGSGGKRKLENLIEYISLSQGRCPSANIRAIAVTDAPIGTKLNSAVYRTLGKEAAEFAATAGWKLLPLQTIGTWVKEAMTVRRENLSSRMIVVLEDFVEWCG